MVLIYDLYECIPYKINKIKSESLKFCSYVFIAVYEGKYEGHILWWKSLIFEWS